MIIIDSFNYLFFEQIIIVIVDNGFCLVSLVNVGIDLAKSH